MKRLIISKICGLCNPLFSCKMVINYVLSLVTDYKDRYCKKCIMLPCIANINHSFFISGQFWNHNVFNFYQARSYDISYQFE